MPDSKIQPPLLIPLDEFSSKNPRVFIGERSRRSSATSVALLDSTTLACCQFDGCRMFLINFDMEKRTFEVAGSIDTVFGGKRCETDLMASDGRGNLITSNFYQHTCSLYRYENGRLRFVRDLAYQAGDRVHGVKFFDSHTVAVTSRHQVAGVHFFDIETMKRRFWLRARGQGVQDVCFTADGRLAAITTLGHPSLFAVPIYASNVFLGRYDAPSGQFELIARRQFATTHVDCIAWYDGHFYITDQYNNRVLVLDDATLEPGRDMSGYTFPHGIDVNFGVVAVTNYGNNTLSLTRLATSANPVARPAVPIREQRSGVPIGQKISEGT